MKLLFSLFMFSNLFFNSSISSFVPGKIDINILLSSSFGSECIRHLSKSPAVNMIPWLLFNCIRLLFIDWSNFFLCSISNSNRFTGKFVSYVDFSKKYLCSSGVVSNNKVAGPFNVVTNLVCNLSLVVK